MKFAQKMGAESSTLADVDKNEYLCRLTGNAKVEREEKFWDELLDFTFEFAESR